MMPFGSMSVPEGALTDGNGRIRPEWREFFEMLSTGSGSAQDLIMGAPPARKVAEYLTAGTSSVAWDLSTAGQPKPYVPANGIDTIKLQDASVTSDKLAAGVVTFDKLQPINTDRLLGRDTPGVGDVEELSVTGGLEFSGSLSLRIADAGVTNAKLANMADATIKGRASGAGTGVPTDLTGTQVADILTYATDAEVRAATTGSKPLKASLIESASAYVALVDAATVAVDWDAGINFDLTVTANRIIGNPTNGQPGTFRQIMVQGNNTTDRAITFGNQFQGELPTIADCDSGRWYLLVIHCYTSTHFVVSSKRAMG